MMTRVLVQLMLILAITIGSVSLAAAQRPWTTVGSAGTVDEADLAEFDTAGPTVRVNPDAPTPSAIVVRHNVVAVDGLFGSSEAVMLVRYRDNGVGARVVTVLKQVSLLTGVVTTLMTFDSNAFPQSGEFQARAITSCPGSPVTFDFADNVYFTESTLTRSNTAGAPALQAIQIGITLC